MARSDAPHDRGALRGTLVLVLVLALVAGGVAAWRYDLLDRWRDEEAAPRPDEPATIAPPPGLDLPPVVAPDAVAEPSSTTGRIDPAAVRRALDGYLGDRDLGRIVLAEVAPLLGGPASYSRGDGAALPASTTKVVTSAAALLALGPEHVFTTEVRSAGGNRIALVGGGDPLLERGPTDSGGEPWPYPVRADLRTLAERTAATLREDGRSRVRLVLDDSMFTGPAENPAWEPGYVPTGEVTPTSALWIDEGRDPDGSGRVADPAASAAAAFVQELAAQGVTVVGDVRRGPVRGAGTLASVDSPPLGSIVERLLEVSDDDAAEVLLRHVGLAVEGEGSIEAGRRGVRSILTEAGVRFGPSVFHDGSGLSRANRADPSTLVDVLQLSAAPDRPDLRPVVTGLPVAGFTGSLTDRMDEGPSAGLGRVRAKTGTLRAVSSLAGLATDLDGNVLVFVLMTDRVRPVNALKAQTTLDSAAAALGACTCSR